MSPTPAGSGPVVTVTCNPMLEWSFALETLTLGGRHRLPAPPGQMTGKGINVSRALRGFGVPTVALFVGTGPRCGEGARRLHEEGIRCEAVDGPSDARVGFGMVETSGRRTTVYDTGARWEPDATAAVIDRALERVRSLDPCFVVLAGSVPPGATPDIYGRMISALAADDLPCAVDASDAVLREALRAGPRCVRVNRTEVADAFGVDLGDDSTCGEVLDVWRSNHGVVEAIVSNGAGPARFLVDGALLRAEPPAVDVVNPTGSGDSMLAGWLAARYEGRSATDAVRMAVAAGTANAEAVGVACVDVPRVESLMPTIDVEEFKTC